MEDLLIQAGVKGKGLRNDLVKYTNLYIEQVFLHSILKEVDVCARSGGFEAIVGDVNKTHRKCVFVPVVAGFAMDNQACTPEKSS